VVLESDFDFVTVDDCVPGSDAEIFDKLEEDLLKQAKVSCLNANFYKQLFPPWRGGGGINNMYIWKPIIPVGYN
jgi:hypothetical protein